MQQGTEKVFPACDEFEGWNTFCALRTYHAFSCKWAFESRFILLSVNLHPKRNTIAMWSPRRPWDREGHTRQVSKEKKLVAFRRKEIQKLEQQMSKGAV